MKTVLTNDPLEAAAFIKRGGIAAFPTETVFGLGANAFDKSAVARIFEAKQRPGDNPLIAHIADMKQIELLAVDVSADAKKLIDAFFPGPLTVVIKKRAEVPLVATAGLDTIGVRMPKLEMAHRFLSACETPVVAPSANLSGRPSPTTWQAVYEDLDGRIDCILQGDATVIGLESTVIDCTGERPVLLRTGAISLDEVRAIVAETVAIAHAPDEPAKSPGLRHRHYTPTARVLIVDNASGSDESAAFIGLTQPASSFHFVRVCATPEEYAHELFEFFRECDRKGIATIYCEAVEERGIGVALMDRLRRAAE